jgi:hypothetical protein
LGFRHHPAGFIPMPSPRRSLRFQLIALLFTLLIPQVVMAAEPAPAGQPGTELIDEKKLLTSADFKDIVAVAVTYIEGDEKVYTVEALGKDVVRVKLGTIKRTDRFCHGILFMLRRTPKGWHQDQNDPASIWVDN